MEPSWHTRCRWVRASTASVQLVQIPSATIHIFRELLEDDGYDRYADHIKKLERSARAFFESEFRGEEFTQTPQQLLRRLYGALEN